MAKTSDALGVSRRGLLMAGGAAVGVLATTGGMPAQAATRRVTQQVAVRWTYDPTSQVTTVAKFRARQVLARFSGRAVFLRRGSGEWTRIPYVWNRRRRALVYSRSLHLRLLGGTGAAQPAPPRADPAPQPTPAATDSPPVDAAPPSGSAPPADAPHAPPTGAWASVTPYVAVDAARHLLNRVGYGPTPGDVADIRDMGVVAWVDQQLAPDDLADPLCDRVLSRLPDQSEEIWHVRDLLDNGRRSGWEQQLSVLTAFTVRALWSKRQLLTVLEDFWGNHFNVTCPGDNISDSRAHYAWTIRRHALGRFADLLTAVTRHPAMLTYLNNRDSDDEHPNENHGRELLELHTAGLDSGYSEGEVLDSARILTGLSVDWESGEYRYKPWRHWVGDVAVLGFTHANRTEGGGEQVALAYLDHLAHLPATARRIAGKLARRFVSDDPPAALVDRLAQTYLVNDTRIAPVLRELLLSDEFAAAMGAKTRRPFEHVVSVARQLGLAPAAEGTDGPTGLLWLAEDGGHNPFGAPFPTGYPDVTAAWLSTSSVLSRWNSTLNLTAGWWPSDFERPALRTHLLGATLPATHGDLVDRLASVLFVAPLLPTHRAAALAFLGKAAGDVVRQNSAAVNWRLPYLVALLLDSPYQALR